MGVVSIPSPVFFLAVSPGADSQGGWKCRAVSALLRSCASDCAKRDCPEGKASSAFVSLLRKTRRESAAAPKLLGLKAHFNSA